MKRSALLVFWSCTLVAVALVAFGTNATLRARQYSHDDVARMEVTRTGAQLNRTGYNARENRSLDSGATEMDKAVKALTIQKPYGSAATQAAILALYRAQQSWPTRHPLPAGAIAAAAVAVVAGLIFLLWMLATPIVTRPDPAYAR